MTTEPPRRVVTIPTKSVGIAILLTVFLGPIGMPYATIPGALVMFVLKLLALLLTAGVGLIVLWPIAIVWSAMAVQGYNRKLLALAR